jgi:hypothetical protein
MHAALKQRWVFEATHKDVPKEVEEQVHDLWTANEYGNDHYYYKTTIAEEEWSTERFSTKENPNPMTEYAQFDKWIDGKDGQCGSWQKVDLRADKLIAWLREQGIPDDEEILIHWWW